MMRKNASFYFNNEYSYLCSDSIHARGLLYMTPPFIKIEWKFLNDSEKYSLIMKVIEASNSMSVFKKDMIFEKEIFNSFGFKSWRQFNEETKLCRIVKDETMQRFELIATEYDGKGYLGIVSEVVHLSINSPTEEFIRLFEKVLLACK